MPATLDDVVRLLELQAAERARELEELAAIRRLLADERRYERTRAAHASQGTDNTLQLVASDPTRGLGRIGLRVPKLPTSIASPVTEQGAHTDPLGFDSRYLFVLSSLEIAEGRRVRLRGMRFTWWLMADLGTPGTEVPSTHYFDIFEVKESAFRLPDGNVSLHLRFVSPGEAPEVQTPKLACPSFEYIYSKGPALLFADGTAFPAANLDPVTGKPDFYTNLTTYVPPAKGRPWGSPAAGGLGQRYDSFVPWRDSQGWSALDIGFTGPGTVMLQASVRQNNPEFPPTVTHPVPYFPLGDCPSQQFVWNYPNAQIFAVAGELIWEDE